MAELGQIAIVGALAMALYAIGASVTGARLRRPALAASGQNAALGVTGLITLASVTLLVAFASHNFALRYVYDHSSRAMPLDMLLPSFYSGQEGSLLYWAWTLSIFFAIVVWQQRRPGPHRALMPYVVATVMVVEAFMTLLLGFVATPFQRLPFTPPDGVGLNPLLYDDGMKIHPPMLLAGYMSWSIPFAFSIAALATNRLDLLWVRLARRYAMVAWLILGLGNLLGAWWAYRVLGWGGYWGWDPVENVALIPWLTGTAFVHSLQIQERRGMLKGWNVALILVTFYLSIFGTFVVRSGVLASVHSFALSAIGPYFLTFLSLAIVGSLALFFRRLPGLRSENQLDSVLSREASFLLNNLLFLGIAFAIFWGTIYPLVAEAVANTKVSVGPPYFQQVATPLLGLMLILMGIGPLMPWRRASQAALVRSFLWPVASAIVGDGVLAALGMRDPIAFAGFAICLFVLATVVQEFARGSAARHRSTGESYVGALGSLIRRNNRRYGGYVAHVGIALIGAGVLGSHAFQQQAQASLQPGQSMQVGSYTLTLQGLQTYQSAGSQTIEAPVVVGSDILRPQKVIFQNFEQQPSTKVALRSTPLEDLYVVLAAWDQNGNAPRVTLSTFVNPMVSWIWTGGLLFLLGTLVALWPAPVPAPRPATARVPAGGAVAPA